MNNAPPAPKKPRVAIDFPSQRGDRYDAPSEVHIELNNGKKFWLPGDGLSLKELHMRIDREQYQLYVEHIKEHAADAAADDDG
ncbi:hypothetical protein, conserved [Eimeria acervulina]|uniref:Uncharacterized protein n=1 Tax=Eimeria acervulina TaxID=5801 RepID=U6GS20_EIMAC|nr:hypothetical protein, conserved [Eimeria acervulina]CDI81404.1 hypothetical protein, conserved [Eimeria acervulina]